MKIGLMFGGAASNNIKSFYVKDGTMYDFENNKPHIFQAACSPQFATQIWSYCFFYEDGCFLNLAEWEDELPDFDFDVIVYANERHGLDPDCWDKYSVDRLKNKYPKAKIIGYIKETTVPERSHSGTNRYVGWIRFLNECDAIMAPAVNSIKELPIYKKILFKALYINLMFKKSHSSLPVWSAQMLKIFSRLKQMILTICKRSWISIR